MGRDEEFKRMQAVRERQSFAQAVSDGTAKVVDRFGQPVKINDLVLYRPPQDPIFRVKDIKPILDTRAPAGLVTIVLEGVMPLNLQVAKPVANMVVIGIYQPDSEQMTTAVIPQGADLATPSPEPADADSLIAPV